jgi:hypothetical protein
MNQDLVPYAPPLPEEAEEVVDAEFYDPTIEHASELLSELGYDLEAALNYIRQYQRALHMLGAPDPNGNGPQQLLQKYNMHHKKPGSIGFEKAAELKAAHERRSLSA